MHEHIGMSTSFEEEISAKPSSHFWSYYKYCVSLQRVILHRRIGISCLLGNFGIKNIVYLKKIQSTKQLDIFMFWCSINILFFKALALFFLHLTPHPQKSPKHHTSYGVLNHPCISILCIPDLNKSLLCIYGLILWWLCFYIMKFYFQLFYLFFIFSPFFSFLLGWTRLVEMCN